MAELLECMFWRTNSRFNFMCSQQDFFLEDEVRSGASPINYQTVQPIW